jgi:hypothetical protein
MGVKKMQTDSRMPQPAFVELPADPPGAATSTAVPLNDADAVRSEENILQWMAYLPEDCIRTMIDMGWDVST